MSHALLSASAAHRWMNCPPSARLTEGIADTTSPYAAEGTLAHEIGELILTKYLHNVDLPDKWERIKAHELFYEGMIDEVSIYTDYVIEQFNAAIQATGDPLIFLETKLDFSAYVPYGYGTGDCIIIADGQMEIVDLKFGKGVEVSAVDNPQLMLYALGAYEQFGFIYDIQTIKMTIAQVRLNHISSSIITPDMLLDWAENTVKPIAALAFEGKGEQTPGEWCRFCKIKADCQARADQNLAFIEANKGKRITIKRLADILTQADEITSWISDIKVSIHAPARGATPKRGQRFLVLCWFQSTHPRGVRQHSKKTKIYSTVEKQLPRTLIKMTKKTHITRLNTTKSLTSVTWRMECGLSNHFRFAL